MATKEIIYIAIVIFLVIFILLKIPLFKKFSIPRSWFIWAFFVKLIAGAALFYVYTFYYSDRSKADIYKYFDDGKIMYESIFSNPTHYFQMVLGIHNDNPLFDNLYYSKMNNWYRMYETVTYNDSHTMIRLHAILFLFSGGYFSLHHLFFIIMSFVGFLLLFFALSILFPQMQKIIFLVTFFIPSVVFWSSGALKESVLMFAMGLNLFSLVSILTQKQDQMKKSEIAKKVLYFFLLMLSFFFLIFIKMYVLVALIPVLLGFVWVELSKRKNAFLKYFLVTIFYIAFLWILGKIFPAYFFPALIVQKQHDFIGLALHEQSKSYFQPLPIQPTILSLAIYSPFALFNAMFRPLLWNTRGVLELLASIESVFYFFSVIIILLFFRKRDIHPQAWLFLFFALLMFLLVGYTTPVSGAIVRYRVPALLFFAIFIATLFDENKFQSFLLKIKFLWKKQY